MPAIDETLTGAHPLEGKTLGNYRIDRLLGEGAMGEVFRATHVALGRPVALKTLKPAVAHDRALTERFFAEARAVNIIRHENIVECTDLVNDPGGTSYIVMELLEGRTLGGAIEQAGRLPVQRAARIAGQIADAIAAAHAHGIVHRDLKPENVYLIKRAGSLDYVKVLDFGIARLRPEHGAMATQTGIIIGTPAYMAPEQVRGEKVGPAADLYALGAIVFHMLAGRLPFTASTMSMMLVAQLQDTPPRLDTLGIDVPPAVADVVARALAKAASDRPADMTAFRDQLLAAAGLPLDAGPAAASSAALSAGVAATVPPDAAIGRSSISAAAGEVTPAPARTRSRWLVAGGAVAVAGAAVALFTVGPWASPSDGSDGSREPVAAASPTPPSPPPTTPPVVAAAPTPTPTPPVVVPEPAPPPTVAPTPTKPVTTKSQKQVDPPKPAPKPSGNYALLLARANELKRGGAGCDILGKAYREALAADPRGVGALVGLGDCALEDERYSEALSHYDSALAFAPRDERALFGYAMTLSHRERTKDQAIAAWKKYLKLYPSSTKGHAALARLTAAPETETQDKPEPEPPKPAGPQTIPPQQLEANRIAGDKQIVPDDATTEEIERAGKTKLVGAFKLCVSETGAVSSVTKLKSTGFADYDAKIERGMSAWRYRPVVVAGKPAPVCTAVTFIYTQTADD